MANSSMRANSVSPIVLETSKTRTTSKLRKTKAGVVEVVVDVVVVVVGMVAVGEGDGTRVEEMVGVEGARRARTPETGGRMLSAT